MTLASIDINICDCGYFDLVQSPIPKWVERHWDTRSTPVAVTPAIFPYQVTTIQTVKTKNLILLLSSEQVASFFISLLLMIV